MRFVLLLSLILSIASPALASERATPSPRPVKGRIAFRLVVDKPAFTRSESIPVKFALKNLGTRPIWVNKRFYLSSSEVPKTEREVFLTVTDPKGQALPCTHTYETGLPKSDDFTLLEPGQEIVSEQPRHLQGYVDLKEPGTYTVAGVYDNAFGPELGLAAFTGPVKSKPVTLTITE